MANEPRTPCVKVACVLCGEDYDEHPLALPPHFCATCEEEAMSGADSDGVEDLSDG